jgi:hypothetical protein
VEIAKRTRKSLTMPLDIWPERPLRAEGSTHIVLRTPSIFSLIANPDESLAALTTLRRAVELRGLRLLSLDHTDCHLLDLCASIVHDILIVRGRRQSAFRAGKFNVRGDLPENEQVKLMLASNGILRQLGLYSLDRLPLEMRSRLRVAELFVGSPTSPSESSAIELAASNLAEFFDDCLKTEKHQLKPSMKSNLIQLITEVLDNAEEHGSGERRWYTIGYYNQHENPVDGGECHIVLFNFGSSIYESLNRPDTSPLLIKQIRELAHEHKARGYFVVTDKGGTSGGFHPLWAEESLWTLYALQEGISRFTNRPEGIDRGNGTVKMMEFFTEIASGQPQMALLSGKTHILFDGKYRLLPIDINGETRKVIAFNAANDLRQRPDQKYVRTLREHFPGTLMSLRFHLRQADLANVKEKVYAES